MEVTEKAGNRSRGLLKAKIQKKVTKKNSRLFIAWKKHCISQLTRANKPKLRLGIVLIHCDIQVYLMVPHGLTLTLSHLGLSEWKYLKYSQWFLCRKASGLNRNPKGPNGGGLGPGSPRGSLFEHGQGSPKDVGGDPPLSLEIPFAVKPSCPPLQEGHGGCCGQGRFHSTKEIFFSLLLCFMAVNSPVKLSAAAQCSNQKPPNVCFGPVIY